MPGVEKIGGKGSKLLGYFPQPGQNGTGVDLADPRRLSNAAPFGQTGDDVDNELRRGSFAIGDRAAGLIKISLA